MKFQIIAFFWLVSAWVPLLNGSLSDEEIVFVRSALLSTDAFAVARDFEGSSYVFSIETPERSIEILIILGTKSDAQAEGDVFVRIKVPAENDDGSATNVGWRRFDSSVASRLFFVVDYSDVLSLGKRRAADPFAEIALGGATTYQVLALTSGGEIKVERKRGESLPCDHLFDFLFGIFVQPLGG